MPDDTYRFNGFRFDTAARELWKGETLVVVPHRVLECLRYLIENRDRAVDREALIVAVWRRNNVSDIQLGQLILRARRAVDDEGNAQHSIRTIVGYGYRWIAETQEETQTEAILPPRDEGAHESARPPATEASDPTPAYDSQRQPPATPSPSSSSSTAGRRRALLVAAMALLLLGMLIVVAWQQPAQAPLPEPTVSFMVLPLDLVNASDAAWARLGGMDLVADRLRRSGLRVASSEMTLAMLGRDAAKDPTRTRRRNVQPGTGMVSGSIEGEARRWRVTLSLQVGTGKPVDVAGDDADLLTALTQASDRLLVRLGRQRPVDSDVAGVAEVLQRARAALLADEPERAMAILEAAPAALQGEPEIRFYLAQSAARAGRFADAEQRFTALLADIGAQDDPRLYLRTLTKRGYVRFSLGRLDDARSDLSTAIGSAGADRWPGDLGEALNGRAMISASLRDLDAAGRDLGSARVQIDRTGDILGVARVDSNLGFLLIERGALGEALAHLERSLPQFDAFDTPRELLVTLAGVSGIQLMQLRNRTALATSDRIVAKMDGIGDRAHRQLMAMSRAEALLANGRLDDARRIVDGVDTTLLEGPGAVRDRERYDLLKTLLALRQQRLDDARDAAQRLPDAALPGGDDNLRALSALIRQRVLGTPPIGAGDAAGAGMPLVLGTASPSARPLRLLAAAERAQGGGDAASADAGFRNALSAAETSGIPQTIATVIDSYAGNLIDQGRLADAAELVGRIAGWADDDFDCAMLQLRLAHGMGDAESWRLALDKVRRIAGQRFVPAGLLDLPPA